MLVGSVWAILCRSWAAGLFGLCSLASWLIRKWLLFCLPPLAVCRAQGLAKRSASLGPKESQAHKHPITVSSLFAQHLQYLANLKALNTWHVHTIQFLRLHRFKMLFFIRVLHWVIHSQWTCKLRCFVSLNPLWPHVILHNDSSRFHGMRCPCFKCMETQVNAIRDERQQYRLGPSQ